MCQIKIELHDYLYVMHVIVQHIECTLQVTYHTTNEIFKVTMNTHAYQRSSPTNRLFLINDDKMHDVI